MIKLFKNLSRKDILIILLCVFIMVFQVWIDLRLPEYMSEITKLIETNSNDINPIFKPGGLMLLCSLSSSLSAVLIGYLSSGLSARFSLKLREKIFK